MGEKACGAWQILLNIQIEIALNGTKSEQQKKSQ